MRRSVAVLTFLVAPLLFARQPSGDLGAAGQGNLVLLLTNPGVRKELKWQPTPNESLFINRMGWDG